MLLWFGNKRENQEGHINIFVCPSIGQIRFDNINFISEIQPEFDLS